MTTDQDGLRDAIYDGAMTAEAAYDECGDQHYADIADALRSVNLRETDLAAEVRRVADAIERECVGMRARRAVAARYMRRMLERHERKTANA